MTPFAPHRSRVRVRVGQVEPGGEVPVGDLGATMRFVAVRPDELLLPGEEFVVVVHSPRGAAAALLANVEGMAAVFGVGTPAVSEDRTRGAEGFAVVLAVRGIQVASELNDAGGPGDAWYVLRADYAHAVSQLPQIVPEAMARAAGDIAELQAKLSQMLADFAQSIAAGTMRGLGAGTIALALGVGAIGIAIWAKARG